MQIETTLRYHFIPVRMAKIKIQERTNPAEDVEKKNPHALLWWEVGMQIDAASVENSMGAPQKNLKNRITV